jgi:uncharacterized protein YxeA
MKKVLIIILAIIGVVGIAALVWCGFTYETIGRMIGG